MILMLCVAGAVMALDHASKALVLFRLREGEATSKTFFGLRFRHLPNGRYGWSSPQAVQFRIAAWIAMLAAGVFLCSLAHAPAARIGIGAVVGGAAGNVLEAIRRRRITDFIDVRVWPVFNVADTAIVAGALVAGWAVISVH